MRLSLSFLLVTALSLVVVTRCQENSTNSSADGTSSTSTESVPCEGYFSSHWYSCDAPESCTVTGSFSFLKGGSETFNGVGKKVQNMTCGAGTDCTYDCCDLPCEFTVNASTPESTDPPSGVVATGRSFSLVSSVVSGLMLIWVA
ncbi:expressed unknown protein [Seminavis robusta]|uniref:Uncharacterized protein n=1 Tax=Seminavis robusta TaxID=568900 RepID=A0A9N8EVK1_9STRA|nr:expressed unknown protein [Seminavis robusta]|eukprot:Sro1950_g307351.1  (145) ;mRNA; r:3456-3890